MGNSISAGASTSQKQLAVLLETGYLKHLTVNISYDGHKLLLTKDYLH